MTKEQPLSRRIVYIGIAIALIIVGLVLPTPDGLSDVGKMSLVLLVAGIFLWVFEPIPIAVSALGLMTLMPFFGVVEKVDNVWAYFISSVIFFILASFGLTAALLKTKVPSKIVFALLKITKGNPRAVVFVFMVAAAIVSLFISDLPCTALFSSIAVSSILVYEKSCDKEKSRLGKCLLIGVAYGSVVGGQAMPSGSSLNIMAMGMLKANTGVSISFLDWTLMCLPISLILIVVCWVSLVVVFKPERLSNEAMHSIQKNAQRIGKLDVLDKKVLAVIILVFVLWTSSNWTGWDATIIAVLGLVLFFLPGIDVLSWKEYVASISWTIVLLIGGVQSLAGGIQEQGAAAWLFGKTVGRFVVSAGGIIMAASVFVPLIRLVIPVGPAFIAICLIPLLGIGEAIGVSVVVLTLIVAINGSTTFLLGLDNNPMLTYQYGYWTFGDYFKVGILPTLAMMLCHATILAPLVALVGY